MHAVAGVGDCGTALGVTLILFIFVAIFTSACIKI